MLKNFFNHIRLVNKADNPHLPLAFLAGKGICLIDFCCGKVPFRWTVPKHPTRDRIMQRRLHSIVSVSGVMALALFSFSYCILSISFAGTMTQSPAGPQPDIVHDIPYSNAGDVGSARRQTLDLYLPRGTKSKPPLLVFVHGDFWALSDDDLHVGPSLADALVTRDIAVALVRYRLASTTRHPAQAQDVAAAVAHLAREADKYGYDAKRIFLAGHGTGAYLAALVALDSSYLTTHRTSPQSLAGVIAIGGIYDLVRKADISEKQKSAIEQAFGNNPVTLKAASPITHVRAHAPPFLILTGSSDFDLHTHIDARKFAEALRAVGHRDVEQLVIRDRDHFSIVQLTGLDNQVRSLLLALLKVQPLPPDLADLVEAKRQWLNPPRTTVPFWQHKKLIRSYPIDRRFVQRLLPMYGPMTHKLMEWPLKRYYAMDLFSYLDSLPQEQVGRGDYLIITNLRNEKQFWTRQQIEPYQPVIVVGIDDEQNLFRFSVFYRMLREYSWKPSPKLPVMVRPVGAFIHFLKEPPAKLRPQPWHYALTKDSFRLVENDPLALLSDAPKDVVGALTHRNGCIYCHSFRGVGARSHHNLASTGAPHGAFALSLEAYPPDVWKAFMFNQHEVAEKIGATPNVVEGNARQALYDLVVKYREKQSTRTK